ncbi:pyridoxal phosphate-dependent aminotransferase [Candidatus Aerophobetes bacterium]|nr:pyridoxal phosphate-dependent aminotransferase [Candidatus Aerophobetes bacterium]
MKKNLSLAKRAGLVSSSLTLAITAKVKEMRQRGVDVIGFGAGEPDFDTPSHIKEEAKRAMDDGFTKYTPSSGIKELKEAISKKFREDNRLNYSLSQIIVSCGAKQCLYNAIQVICEEGDEVILPSPYWVSYPEQIKLSGAVPRILKTRGEDGFKINPQTLSNRITPKTKLLILNSPNNPTGAVYSKDELKAIAEIAIKNNIYIISDEIYEKTIYEAKHTSIASLNSKIKDLTIVINGVSKTYSMTGWRIGYAAGKEEIIKAMSNLQSHSTSNPTSFAQKGALAAISGPQDSVIKMRTEFKKRRDYMLKKLNQIPGISCTEPRGAFYLFPNISKLIGRSFNGKKIKNSLDLTDFLLREARVAVVPGVAFGADNYIRLSYATSMDNIIKGIERLKKAVSKLF